MRNFAVPFVELSPQQARIYLQENGFTDLAKPGGTRMEACARGQLLILAPWEHHNEQQTIRRDQCLKLNDIARHMSTSKTRKLPAAPIVTLMGYELNS